MQYENITTDAELKQFCDELRLQDTIAFDTEFISERTYRPELCLIQVATGDHLAIIDTLSIDDLTPFWERLAEQGHETIVHAGREEFCFSLSAIGKRPHNLVDVQLAAGMIGMEYPAGYGNLVNRLLGKSPAKGETRTDWRRRPLSKRQLEYALNDVVFLKPLRDKIFARLEKLGRVSWLSDEMSCWQDDIERFVTAQRWRRVSGISNLSRRSLAAVRELWKWRESVAKERNRPARQVLRDDLVVEIAKRGLSDPKRISAIRGMDRPDLSRAIPQISESVQTAMNLPEEECPRQIRQDGPPQLNLLGQFLSSALSSICRSSEIATSLVGTSSNVRELIAYHLGIARNGGNDELPALARGWRAEVVGDLIDELLDGRVSIHIKNPTSDHPLVFEPRSVDDS